MAEAISVRETVDHFLNSLDSDKAKAERPSVEQFMEWVGADRQMSDLTGDEISKYVEQETTAEQDELLVEPLRALLAYSSRLAFTTENLVPFLHLSGDAGGARGGAGAEDELGGAAYHMTREGLENLERELEELKGQRPEIAEKLHAAMADKDFRENAPLDAARDEQAHLESRIRDAEDRLRHAVIIDTAAKGGLANVGSVVRLLNLASDAEQTFTLVSPNEVDPSNGRISIQSPVGVAVSNRGVGDEVEVNAPAGPMRYRVLEVIG